jgi:antitoxin (DNA-binding transcriptional repressor) of toxin-antitoxin stability system
MPDLIVNVTDFKARCLAILDDMDTNGTTVTVTKRGHPVATIKPVRAKCWTLLKGALAGKVKIPDDILETDRSKLWDVACGI